MTSYKKPEIHTRLGQVEFDELIKLAEKQKVTLSGMVRKVIIEFLKKYDLEGDSIDELNPLNQYYSLMTEADRIAFLEWKENKSSVDDNFVNTLLTLLGDIDLNIALQEFNQKPALDCSEHDAPGFVWYWHQHRSLSAFPTKLDCLIDWINQISTGYLDLVFQYVDSEKIKYFMYLINQHLIKSQTFEKVKLLPEVNENDKYIKILVSDYIATEARIEQLQFQVAQKTDEFNTLTEAYRCSSELLNEARIQLQKTQISFTSDLVVQSNSTDDTESDEFFLS